MINDKLRYFVSSAAKQLSGKGMECPSCKSAQSEVVDRKYIVTELRRCKLCDLLFRVPTTSENENASFYQSQYSQGFTTNLPDDKELSSLIATCFRNTEKDYTTYIRVLKALGGTSGMKLFDYGCSWGYGSWQLQSVGYDVTAYEISKPRAEYAQHKLNIRLDSNIYSIEEEFDIFFSAHVLEHVPAVQDAIHLSWKMLRPGGLFIAFTPNGSAAMRTAQPKIWHKLWGNVHPQFLDDKYYAKFFASYPFLVTSDPYEDKLLSSWQGKGQILQHLSGTELLLVACKTSLHGV